MGLSKKYQREIMQKGAFTDELFNHFKQFFSNDNGVNNNVNKNDGDKPTILSAMTLFTQFWQQDTMLK